MPHLVDRPPHILEMDPGSPLPPLNISCNSVMDPGIIDLRWSHPAELQSNSKFSILGVNIYRSFDSEFGPWVRLNLAPVGATFYRDQTRILLAMQEDVSSSFIARGDTDPNLRWVFRVKHAPMHLESIPWMTDCTNANVYVTVNGQQAFVEAADAFSGEVHLRSSPTFDVASQKLVPAVIPSSSSDVVLATYKYLSNVTRSHAGQRIFYRITTVGSDVDTGELLETPLQNASKTNNMEVEKLDWIWREAIRRNRFILDHGGERVKAFIQKRSGTLCGCYVHSHRQAASDCLTCFGTSIIGGYEGPYDITIAPDDGEKAMAQTDRGRNQSHSYDTWTGPSPLLSQRDFIVKLNGDRYGIGPVRMPSNRGMLLQQFFQVSSLDEADIRYEVPIPDTSRLVAPRNRYEVPGGGSSTPMMTERENIPDEREFRGSTITYQNYHQK